jgi:hypothetical protein
VTAAHVGLSLLSPLTAAPGKLPAAAVAAFWSAARAASAALAASLLLRMRELTMLL